jgi:hypothetical protein
VHDFEQLIILSGIYPEFQKEIVTNKTFRDQWSFISKWNENARYLVGKNSEDVKDFLTSIKEVMRWIQKHL